MRIGATQVFSVAVALMLTPAIGCSGDLAGTPVSGYYDISMSLSLQDCMDETEPVVHGGLLSVYPRPDLGDDSRYFLFDSAGLRQRFPDVRVAEDYSFEATSPAPSFYLTSTVFIVGSFEGYEVNLEYEQVWYEKGSSGDPDYFPGCFMTWEVNGQLLRCLPLDEEGETCE